MKSKIDMSKRIIEIIAKRYMAPIIYSGFGKDSICNVHLCRSMGFDWPIMFHREHWFPRKQRYANMIIDRWNLVCYDYPPFQCSIHWWNDVFEVVRHFQLGNSYLAFCALLYEPKEFIEGEYLCALKDQYLQPKGTRDYIWDVGIMGFRYSEVKPHSRDIPAKLRWEFKHNIGSVDMAFPLREWTNQEVYQYILENEIPINELVYEVRAGELVPKIDPDTGEIDSTYNPDRRPACFRCMIPESPMMVPCPKMDGFLVNNVSESLLIAQMPNDFPGFPDSLKIKEDRGD